MMTYKDTARQIAYKAAWAQYFAELEKGFDVVLPPEEQTPEIVQFNNNPYLTSGNVNWAAGYLLSDEMLDKVIQIALAKNSQPVLVQIVDTAPYFDHPDLQAFSRNDLAVDFVPGRTLKRDANGHGTHCGGAIAANNPAVGLLKKLAEAGLVRIQATGSLNDQGSGAYSWISQGIRHGVELQNRVPGWRVITSLSLGGSSDSQEVKEAIDYVISKGVFVSASAGNSYGDGSKSTMGFPGRYTPVKAVGAINKDGSRAPFSSVGDLQNNIGWVAAPGVNIYSTYRNGSYAFLDGTSMANPISVAMDVCLLLMYPEIQNQAELKAFLAKFATDLGPTTGYDIFTFFGAPKLAAYFDKTPPVGDPNPPADPNPPSEPNPPAPKLRAERVLDVPLQGEYSTLWKPYNQPDALFQPIHLKLELDFKTKYYAEDAVRILHGKIKEFFTNSAYVLLADDDLNEAIYWVRHFTEMILKTEGFDVYATAITGKDKAGNLLQLKGEDRRLTPRGLVIGSLQKRKGVDFIKVGKGEVKRIVLNQ